MRRATIVAILAALVACDDDVPTSALVTLVTEPPAARPDAVELSLLDDQGVAFEPRSFAVPQGDGTSLGDVTVFPPRPTRALRVLGTGRFAGAVVSTGTVEIVLREGVQVGATLVLRSGAAASDGGVDAGLGVDGGSVDAETAALTLGKPCGGAGECASGFCVAGVCCASACTAEAAESCGRDGTCDATGACRRHAAGTMCGAGSCTSNVDRRLASTCDGAGACVPGETRSCAPFACAAGACTTMCRNSTECAPGKTCVSGSCGGKPLGTSCGGDGECASGQCADGVCCDVNACEGPCRACNVAGMMGSCRPKSQGATCGAATCSEGSLTPTPTCDGAGTCAMGQRRACAPCLCAGDRCSSTCDGSEDCASNAYCDRGACRTKQGQGGACSSGAACTNGLCVDGRCCNTACTETCKRCDFPPGLCSNIQNGGTDSNATTPCRSPQSCDGQGMCR